MSWDSSPVASLVKESLACTSLDFDELIDSILGPLPAEPSEFTQEQLSIADVDEAYANMITDVAIEAFPSETGTLQYTS